MRVLLLLILLLSNPASAEQFSPFVDAPRQQLLWGDTHLHTAYSSDAGLIGTTLQPADAYRFARGEEVLSSTGVRARISRPLDFLVISDHAESLGLPIAVREEFPALLANPWGSEIHRLFKSGRGHDGFMKWAIDGALAGKDPLREPSINAEVWRRQVETADQYNDPGAFTALIGFEWTNTANSKNLHRVVILRDAADRAGQIVPFSSWDSLDPEALWDWMDAYEKNTGGRILAIPHNANLSNGLMFGPRRADGSAFDKDYAERRQRHEPLVEVTQVKGDGEAHPWLSPDDEFADFGNWDWADVGAREPKTPDMLQYEYARSALKLGLAHEAALGVNPFRFGMIGSSDSHTGLSTVREDNYFSKFSHTEPRKGRGQGVIVNSPTDEKLSLRTWHELASGLAAVWAENNTREAIFDALERREVYATSGSRITVRFFGGWDYTQTDVDSPRMPAIGYRRGVPMGSDLGKAAAGGAPVFMLAARRDPDGANLDRVQVIKGWLDGEGNVREKVFDVALSGGRRPGGSPVTSTVDVDAATWKNTVGAAELRAFWRDPEFDPALRAFYYARVLEIPKPSWQAYDRLRFGDDFPASVPMTVQDRAYTSPIWYSPK